MKQKKTLKIENSNINVKTIRAKDIWKNSPILGYKEAVLFQGVVKNGKNFLFRLLNYENISDVEKSIGNVFL